MSSALVLIVALDPRLDARLDAQVTLLEPKVKDQGGPEVPAQNFLTLNGERGAVRFLPGGLDRAHHVLARVELVTKELSRWSAVPVSTAVYLVDRRQWKEVGLPGLYELPLRTSPTGVVLAVQGDAESVANWRRWLGVQRLPLIPGVPTVGTPEEAAALALADVLLQIEIARELPVLNRVETEERWESDLIAHTAALILFERFERQRVDQIAEVFRRIRFRLAPWGAAIQDYDSNARTGSPEDVDRWLWFQAVLFEGAQIVYARDGRGAIEDLGKLMAKEGGTLTTSALTARYPRLGEWLGRYRQGPK